MIGAGQHLGTAALSIDQPGPAVAADVGERPHRTVVAANDNDAFAQIIDGPPFARLGDFAFVADDLRRRAQEGPLLRLEEFRVVIKPTGKAGAVQRIGIRDEVQGRCHGSFIAAWMDWSIVKNPL